MPRPQPPLQVCLSERYILHRELVLGAGVFAKVIAGQERATGSAVAIKLVDQGCMRLYGDLIAKEATVWSAAGQHANIVQLREAYQGSECAAFVSGERCNCIQLDARAGGVHGPGCGSHGMRCLGASMTEAGWCLGS